MRKWARVIPAALALCMMPDLLGPALAVFFCRLTFDRATISHPVPNKLPKLLDSGVRGMKANRLLQKRTE